MIGISILLGALFITLSIMSYVSREESNFLSYHNLLDRLRFEEYTIQRSIVTNDTNHSFEIIRASQYTNSSDEIPGFLEWNDTSITTQYTFFSAGNESKLAFEHAENRTVITNYPAKKYIETTKGLSPESIAQCVCPSIDQDKCNALNQTNYTWGVDVCAGLPAPLRVFVYEDTQTSRAFPYYVFGRDCAVICS